jgi:hypothetical protein
VCPTGFPPDLRVPPPEGLVLARAARSGGGITSDSTRARTRPARRIPTPAVDPERAWRVPRLLRKEVIQPHLPVRLPCYDFTPIADPTFDGSLHKGWATGFGCYRLSWCDGRCVQGPGTYSPQHC